MPEELKSKIYLSCQIYLNAKREYKFVFNLSNFLKQVWIKSEILKVVWKVLFLFSPMQF